MQWTRHRTCCAGTATASAWWYNIVQHDALIGINGQGTTIEGKIDGVHFSRLPVGVLTAPVVVEVLDAVDGVRDGVPHVHLGIEPDHDQFGRGPIQVIGVVVALDVGRIQHPVHRVGNMPAEHLAMNRAIELLRE
jgi:hypothetical protein